MFDGPSSDTWSGHGYVQGGNAYAKITGPGVYARAEGFDNQYAYKTSSGADVARFYDTPGDDVFSAKASSTAIIMDAPDTWWQAGSFQTVYAETRLGENDSAYHVRQNGVR